MAWLGLSYIGKTKVKKIKIEKYANKINFNCCDHRSNRNKYFLGYAGVKCCKVAMCLDCDKVQFVGGRVGRLLYPIIKMCPRNRIEIIDTIEIAPFVAKSETKGEMQ